jgi:hypothetical protein
MDIGFGEGMMVPRGGGSIAELENICSEKSALDARSGDERFSGRMFVQSVKTCYQWLGYFSKG